MNDETSIIEGTLDEVDVQEAPPPTLGGYVTLRMTRTRDVSIYGREWKEGNLDYGPASVHDGDHHLRNIKFNDGFATPPADHPLITEVLAKYPCEIVTTEDKSRVYVDSDGREQKSKAGLKASQRARKAARRAPSSR